MRIVIMGNAGSGKSTLARRLVGDSGVPILSLDGLAWSQDDAGAPVRRPLEESTRDLLEFIDANEAWIVEGCYGDLVEAALPHCRDLRFLNPGVDVCVRHCLERPWEPDKFPSREAQDAMLETLVAFVREYERRADEFGLACHRRIFDTFSGVKREYRGVEEYDEDRAAER